jgi:ATP-binding protein involved in chromosome partitioning
VRGSKAGAGQTDLLPTVKNVVLVAAGKGGVGKSTVAANLAVALKAHGATVGLLDADIYGPRCRSSWASRRAGKVEVNGVQKIAPTMAHGIPVMSIGFLDADQAVIARPMLGKALHQLMADVHWGELDYLVSICRRALATCRSLLRSSSK